MVGWDREEGRRRGVCPYFLTRHFLSRATIIVYNYQYLLDPKVSGMVSREIERSAVVVFDEAHNIDNVCIEALSVMLNQHSLRKASTCISNLSTKVQQMKAKDAQRLRGEYESLVNQLQESGVINSGGDGVLASPILPDDILQEAVPGNIRRAEHFLGFMREFVQYLRTLLANERVEVKTPLAFLHHLNEATAIESKPLKFTYSRLNSLLRTLQLTNLDEFNPLQDVSNFATLVATYSQGFAVISEPDGSLIMGISEPILHLACLDASIAIKPVFNRFQSVVITSGTLSPLDLYPKLLNFHPGIRSSLNMSTFRPPICPLVITKGRGGQPISTKFSMRDDESGRVLGFGSCNLSKVSTCQLDDY